jgi:DNA-binding response OmpR family regulator
VAEHASQNGFEFGLKPLWLRAQTGDEVEDLVRETLLALHTQRGTCDPIDDADESLPAGDAHEGSAHGDLNQSLQTLPRPSAWLGPRVLRCQADRLLAHRDQSVRTGEPSGGSMRPMPTPPPHLLVIEDEQDIAALLHLHLSDLPATVKVIPDGQSGLAAALGEPFDAIVLDLRLPGLSGLDICRELRARGHRVPLLMLTARAAELDRVLGLELGADDYVTKPFSVLELKARVRALLRRAAPPVAPVDAPSQLACAELNIDRTRRRAWLGTQELVLTPREFDLLWHFMGHPGRAFTRAELLEQVWGYGHDGYDHTVNSHINRLRAKLGDDRSESRFIHTVWGIGYRFEWVEAP